MNFRIGAGTLALALTLAACGDDAGNEAAAPNMTAPLTSIPAPNNANWTEIVTQTTEGGYRMGNPDAPVKLVEYASITCHVCADFSEEGSERLKNEYVRSGQVSWEYRPFMLFPSDPGIFMLLRCMGPGPFFRLAEQLYVDQETWAARLQALPEDQLQQIRALPPEQAAAAYVRAAEVDQFFRQRGMSQARIDSCYSAEQLEQLTAITERGANQENVRGTPTFFINGEIVPGVANWAGLEPILRQRIGG